MADRRAASTGEPLAVPVSACAADADAAAVAEQVSASAELCLAASRRVRMADAGSRHVVLAGLGSSELAGLEKVRTMFVDLRMAAADSSLVVGVAMVAVADSHAAARPRLVKARLMDGAAAGSVAAAA